VVRCLLVVTVTLLLLLLADNVFNSLPYPFVFFFYKDTSSDDAKSEAEWDQLAAAEKVSHPMHQMMLLGKQRHSNSFWLRPCC
jgi:hypothetical protein